ncbi:MAG: 23S rRNA (pseudouridine(1915)-N(3))-methyltransferase RlmH [Parachlamydiales bacterium]|jgi:23S rRNA (pseudouridine1915-N3)-methyltransferase
MQITLYSVGKTKEQWLEEACAEYIKRLSPYVKFSAEWAKDDAQLIKITQKERLLLCLDPAGEQYTSEDFSALLMKKMEQGGARLGIVIGGPEGLPAVLKTSNSLVSFSKMTFTHQCIRLLLLEQLYRAFEIARGSPYHK